MIKSERPIVNKPWLEAHHQQPTPFPDTMFSEDGDGGSFSKSKLMLQVDELKHSIEEFVASSPRLVPENHVYTLGIHTHLPPHIGTHLQRVQLKHSLLETDAPICLFVKDLKTPDVAAPRSGRKTTHQNDPYEHTVKHYEKLLKQHNIDSNITIITMKQLFSEFVTIDERRKLYFMYDKLLVDSQIALIINSYLGYKLSFEGRLALPIDLNSSIKLSDELNAVLRTGPILYRIFENRGKVQHIRIGRHTSMSTEEMVENIIDFLQHCDMIIAGGTANIERITLKPNVHVSHINLYVNKKPVEFPTPLVKTDDEIKIEPDTNQTIINDNDIKNEDFYVSMIDEEMEKLLERDWTENTSIIGPDFVCDENDDDQIRFVHYGKYDDEDDKISQMNEKSATTNGNAPAKTNNLNNNQAKQTLNGRNPEEVNRLIMEGLKKILRTGTLPQIADRGVNQSNNPISRRKRQNRV